MFKSIFCICLRNRITSAVCPDVLWLTNTSSDPGYLLAAFFYEDRNGEPWPVSVSAHTVKPVVRLILYDFRAVPCQRFTPPIISITHCATNTHSAAAIGIALAHSEIRNAISAGINFRRIIFVHRHSPLALSNA